MHIYKSMALGRINLSCVSGNWRKLFVLTGYFAFLNAGMGIQDAVSAKLVLEKWNSEH